MESATYPAIDAFDLLLQSLSPRLRAEQVRIVCSLAAEEDLNALGALSSGNSHLAVANTHGIFTYHASTHAEFQIVVMGPDSSGHARACAWRVADLPVEALAREALQKAKLADQSTRDLTR